MNKKRLSGFAALILMACAGARSEASKFDFYVGGYDFSAKTSSSSGSKSGFGAYKVAYQLPLFEQFEAGIGYTLIFSDTFGGDAIFGFDFEGSYFPLSPSSSSRLQAEHLSVTYAPIWKPFVGLGYHARQFQSVSTQYNGFSGAVGVERALDAQFNAKGMLRYGQFLGAKKGEATEISVLLGISFGF